jgi:hypothetical protein
MGDEADVGRVAKGCLHEGRSAWVTLESNGRFHPRSAMKTWREAWQRALSIQTTVLTKHGPFAHGQGFYNRAARFALYITRKNL